MQREVFFNIEKVYYNRTEQKKCSFAQHPTVNSVKLQVSGAGGIIQTHLNAFERGLILHH